jgi:hypothetical protein
MSFKKSLLYFYSLLLIYSCGGGGGGGGSQPAPAPVPAPPPSYVIAEGTIFSSSLPSTLYIDENMNGMRDSYEKTATPSSNGAFSFTTSNSAEVSCLENLHILSETPKGFSYNPSAGQNVKINPFTTLLMDRQFAGINWSDHSRVTADADCTSFELYKLNYTKGQLEGYVIPRMNKFDGVTYEALASDPAGADTFDSQAATKSQDLEKFYSSLQSIEQSVLTDLQNLIITNLPGQTVSLKARSELDTSNLRIFLNSNNYPNPSTDPSPIADGIDSIAVRAGLEFYLTLENYSGTWDNTLDVLIGDIKINNAGNVLQDNESCYINFSSICKVDPTFSNVIAYGSPYLVDLLHKKTTRGIEAYYSIENIEDPASLSCSQSDNLSLADTSLENETRVYVYREFLGTGTYNINDFACYRSSSGSWNLISIENLYSDSSEADINLYFRKNNKPSFVSSLPSSINYDFYDEVDTPPEQIPAAYINAFLELGKGGWETVEKILSSGELRTNNAQLDFYFYTAENRVGLVRALFGSSNSTLICVPIDGEVISEQISNNDMETSNFTTLDACRTQFVSNYQATSERTINNISPYRGLIDE